MNQYIIQICPLGSYCMNGHKEVCPAGVYGNTEGLSTASCTSPCPMGYYCPANTAFPIPCNYNNPNEYCPLSTSQPFLVKLGYYSNNNQILSATTSSSSLITDRILLINGGYSNDGGGGILTTSTLNNVIISSSNSNNNTSIMQAPDNIIPSSNIFTYQLGGFASQEICPPGSYCVDGIRYLCPAGRYGMKSGETNSSCTGPCAVGYYCPAGSISKIQIPCGSHHNYCPFESKTPLVVSKGHYTLYLSNSFNVENNNLYPNPTTTTNNNNGIEYNVQMYMEQSNNSEIFESLYMYNSLRNGNQSICEPGYYCLSDGIRRPCPVGRYGSTYGLSDASCTGPCPEGYFCPRGTANATQYECGNATYYCPVGAMLPYKVHVGYYTGKYIYSSAVCMFVYV